MKGRTLSRALFATLILPMVAQPRLLQANPLSPPSGSYELTARLELPHLERWGVDKTTLICLSNSRGPDEIPVPVVSANNPFARCSAANLVADGSKLEYDIVCPERGSARGHAVYKVSSDAFTGRIAMVMGAKNMTMTEVQHARRVGECTPAKLRSAGQFYGERDIDWAKSDDDQGDAPVGPCIDLSARHSCRVAVAARSAAVAVNESSAVSHRQLGNPSGCAELPSLGRHAT
jgi:hypothetical protein